MTVLGPGALAGVRLRVVGADTDLVRRTADAAAACGAVPAVDGDAADQVLVGVDVAGGGAAFASGAVADGLTAAFTATRDAVADLPAGAGLVLLVTTAATMDPAGGAVGALCRSVALECAGRGVRVNAVLVPVGADPGAIVPLLLSPAATMMTGAVLEVA